MKLERAIELSGYLDADPGRMRYLDYKEAVKLGIEALKHIQEERLGFFSHRNPLLPGETKEYSHAN